MFGVQKQTFVIIWTSSPSEIQWLTNYKTFAENLIREWALNNPYDYVWYWFHNTGSYIQKDFKIGNANK